MPRRCSKIEKDASLKVFTKREEVFRQGQIWEDYLLSSVESGTRGSGYKVKLDLKALPKSTCTCMAYVVSGKPCKHVMAVALKALSTEKPATGSSRSQSAIARATQPKAQSKAKAGAASSGYTSGGTGAVKAISSYLKGSSRETSLHPGILLLLEWPF